MEIGRPSRSGIPTFVGSHNGRSLAHRPGVDSSGQFSRSLGDQISPTSNRTLSQSTARTEGLSCSSRTEGLSCSSRTEGLTCPTRTEGLSCSSSTEELFCPATSSMAPLKLPHHNQSNGHVHAPDYPGRQLSCRPGLNHLPQSPRSRPYMNYAYIKKKEAGLPSQNTSQPTLHHSSDTPYPEMTSHHTLTPVNLQFQPATSTAQDPPPRSFGPQENSATTTATPSPAPQGNPWVNTSARPVTSPPGSSAAYPAPPRCLNKAATPDPSTAAFTVSPDKDYPIRGIISPLRNHVLVKRSLGTVDEMSFVFGRPVSSCQDSAPGYPPPQSFTSPASLRQATLSQSRYQPRALSPSSDILPVRRGMSPGVHSGRRVLSPPPGLCPGLAEEYRKPPVTLCERCTSCLVELKRQALRLLFPDSGPGCDLAQNICPADMDVQLTLPQGYERWFSRAGHCGLCQTAIGQLKREAVSMVKSLQLAQTPSTCCYTAGTAALTSPPHHQQNGVCPSYCRPLPASSSTSSVSAAGLSPSSSSSVAVEAQAYLDQNVRAYIGPNKASQVVKSRPPVSPGVQPTDHRLDTLGPTYDTGQAVTPSNRAPPCQQPPHHHHHHHYVPQLATDNQQLPGYNYHSGCSTNTSSLHQPQVANTMTSISNHTPPVNTLTSIHNYTPLANTVTSIPNHTPLGNTFLGGTNSGVTNNNITSNPGVNSPTSPGISSPNNTVICSPTSPPAVHSIAASFFARAAQRLGKKKKHQQSQDQELVPSFPTNFSEVIRLTPPAAPPCLLRTVGRLQNPGMGKVKVMLKICSPPGGQGEHGTSFLSADPRKKQVTVIDPSASGYITSANRRTSAAVPKMFAFDSVYTPDDSLTELCSGSLSEILQAVVAGADGCLFTYGYSKLGKTFTMTGSDQSPSSLGVMPCAIAWLFKLINEQKDRTGARFSVRVSAVQVTGRDEGLKDLLADMAQGSDVTGVGAAPSVYLREDPICGTQLENQSELRAPTADRAALYLDAALAARSVPEEDEARSSHMLFTLNVYQYRIERGNTKAGLPEVAGGRSRLHLIDLGSASKSKDPNKVSLSLSALGNVVMALLNGQRHLPHRDSKIAQLLKDSLGNLSCRTCMLAHVSGAMTHYNESLQVIQLAARIHRMKRRRMKFSSTSSEDSSTDGDTKFRRPYRGLRMGTLREEVLYTCSHSDPDYTSSSEQSCDTVIYIGAAGQSLSDRELTDNEGPPRHVPRTNPRLPRRPSGSRSSGDDSDSGRSMHSVRSFDSRLPTFALKKSSMETVGPVMGSTNPGLTRIGHRVGLGSKGTGLAVSDVHRPAKIHCPSSVTKIAKAIHERVQPLEGERWIDGPGVGIYSESSVPEMWVDGPTAFVSQPQAQTCTTSSVREEAHHHHRQDSSSKRLASKKVDAEEQWVDGPKEMVSGASLGQPMHTCSKVDNVSRSVHLKMSTAVNEQALKHALVKHILETKDPAEVCAGTDRNAMPAGTGSHTSTSLPCGRSADDPCKMVEDFIVYSSSSNAFIETSSSPVLAKKTTTASETSSRIHATPQPHLTCSTQPPTAARTKISGEPRLQKSQLPSSASPTHRVVQWIKSVSSKPTEAPVSNIPGPLLEQQTSQSPSDAITLADAETNTEHDSDFERLAAETKSDSDEDNKLLKTSSNSRTSGSLEGEHLKCHTAVDTSLDSSFDNPAAVVESIYEHEVEQCLEHMAGSHSKHASEGDNDTFSNKSRSNKDSEELEHDEIHSELESLLVHQTNVLTQSKLKAHYTPAALSGRGVNKASYAQYESADVINPLLSRKPDGASKSDLLSLFVEEMCPDKGDRSGIPGSSLLASADQKVCGLKPAAFMSCFTGQLESDSSCECPEYMDSTCCSQADVISTSPVSSTQLAAQRKPPLPTKSSVPKLSGPAKPGSWNQLVTNPDQHCSIYCTAKPTCPGKDQPVTPPKTVSGSKASAIPLSSNSVKNKSSPRDKATSPSTSTPHPTTPPSPRISPTSKSSSSASVLKSSCKSTVSSVSKSSVCSKTFSLSQKDCGKSRKKEKEKDTKGGSTARTTKFSDLVLRGKGNDSDSGNDSGIVSLERRLLSPYATVTKPRTPSHSSSGHGSDQSTISTEVHSSNSRPNIKGDTLHGGGTSSGYESMLRDSEATGSSGHEGSDSESCSECPQGTKLRGTKRSHSAPSRSNESSPVSSQPSQSGAKSTASASKVWLDTRHLQKVKDEPLELKRYDPDEVERFSRRRNDNEVRVSPDSLKRSKEEGDQPVTDPNDVIMLERNGWSFDCKLLMCFSCKSGQRGSEV